MKTICKQRQDLLDIEAWIPARTEEGEQSIRIRDWQFCEQPEETQDEFYNTKVIIEGVDTWVQSIDLEFKQLDEIDLFEHYYLLPKEVLAIVESFDDNEDLYDECRRLEKELTPHGYTFDWGLDGVPFNLRKLQYGATYMEGAAPDNAWNAWYYANGEHYSSSRNFSTEKQAMSYAKNQRKLKHKTATKPTNQ